jgi:hypothetical protein
MIPIYALIVDNVVVNIVEADEHWISQQTGDWVAVRIDPETETFIGVGVGWTYDENLNTFVPPLGDEG